MVSLLVCLAQEEVERLFEVNNSHNICRFFPSSPSFFSFLVRLFKPVINHQRVVDSWFADRQPMGLTHYPLIIFLNPVFL